jgi:hypothetical protein
MVPAPYSQPSQPTSRPAFQLEAPTFQQLPPQPPMQAQAQARPPGPSGRPLPQPNTARQGRPLPQPQPRGQPRTPPTAAAPPSTPAPVAAATAPVVSPLQPTARSPAFAAASPAPAPPAPEPRRTEAERDSDVDELASVIFKIEGLDQFSSVTASQVPSVPPPRLRAWLLFHLDSTMCCTFSSIAFFSRPGHICDLRLGRPACKLGQGKQSCLSVPAPRY